MRLVRLASLGAPRPCLLVAPALLIAANLGVAGLKSVPDAPPRHRSHVVEGHELARISSRPLATQRVRAPIDRRVVTRINDQLIAGRPALAAALRKAVSNSPPPPQPSAPSPSPPPPPPPPVAFVPLPVAPDNVWRSLSLCESGGNWQRDSGNGYYGGLQFSQASWESVGGSGFPHENPPERQIELAERLQARQGWDAWPSCSDRLGLL